MPCGATQDGRVMGERSDRMWSTGEGNGKPLQYSCLENPVNSMRRQKDRTLKDELPRLVSAQYATGDQWRNNSRKNEEMEPKQNNTQLWMWLVIEGKSNSVKSNIAQEPGMLGPWIKVIGCGQAGDGKSEHQHFRNQWTFRAGRGEFNSGDHYIYYSGQESLRRNGVALKVSKRVQNAVQSLECNLKNDRIISGRG